MGIDGIENLKEDGDDGVFPHQCTEPGCQITVAYDDEPWCFQHSPDEGSSVVGYSAREEAKKKMESGL